MQRAKIDPQEAARKRVLELPPEVMWVADNYNHLMEQPTIFYATALAAQAAGQGNAFNVGLLLLTCPQADRIADGEAVAFDARVGRVLRAGGEILDCKPLSTLLLDLVEAGGLLNQLKRRRNLPA